MKTLLCGAFALLMLLSAAQAAPMVANGRRFFGDNIRALPSPAAGQKTFVARTALTSGEKAETLHFVVSLKMPHFVELQAALAKGQQVGKETMEQRFLPPVAEYRAVQTWLRAQGFTISMEDPSHTNISAEGTVHLIEAAFNAHFVRVRTDEGEFSSVDAAPSMPADISATVIEVSGLQPHLHLHVDAVTPDVTVVSGSPGWYGVFPSDIIGYYNAGTRQSGSGQTIAIIMDSDLNTSDISSFNSLASVTRTGSFTAVSVNGGAGITSDVGEAAMDVEWSGGIAPGANIRLYRIPSLSTANIIAALTQINSDASTYNISVVSMSFGGAESLNYSLSYTQALATTAASGITNIASSGDKGCYAYTGTSTWSLEPQYPASDPNVTGVGGTTISTLASSWTYNYETLYSEVPSSGSSSTNPKNASSGGVSAQFNRPSWQYAAGSILTSQTKRCVPDVAAFWGVLPSYSQSTSSWQSQAASTVWYSGAAHTLGGTSLSAPIWAGIVARLNEARSGHGIGKIGSLGPWIYLLANSASFKDITASNSNTIYVGSWTTFTHSNGAYSTGSGYDLCTGLGRPDIAHFISVLEEASGSLFVVPPTITIMPNYLGGSITVIKPTGYSTTP